MILSLIVAMAENRVIGKGNQLPWHISEDLKRFKKITMGHPLIMGRKTFESIGRPLPGRKNIVLTRDKAFWREGIIVTHSVEDSIGACNGAEAAFVIGGAHVYEVFFPKIDRIHLTLIHKKFEGDTFFPEFDLERDFKITTQEEFTGGPEGFPYSYIVADRSR